MGEGGSIGLMGSRDEAYRFAISNSDMTKKYLGCPVRGTWGATGKAWEVAQPARRGPGEVLHHS